ncbi:MAG: glycosyltransferase family 2 protein [Patescibacteria group bacterium]|nr:glycosyltransferase family 2 protein [Patescibacteria group bacterium]
MERKNKITVLVPTYNVENILKRCLKSADWADEILVVDSFSKDRTLAIARKMGAKIIQHEYVYSAKQKNWAIPRAKNKWVLLLDSDEVITAGLREEIKKLLESKDLNNYDGFGIARRHYFLGRFLRWGGRYPLYNVRLFKKTCRYEDRDVHAHIILPKSKVKNLKGDILHYSDPNLSHFFAKFNRYTTYQADYMLKFSAEKHEIEWKKFFTYYIYSKSVIKDYWYFLPLTPFLRFVYMYFLRFGFLDGRYGFLIAVLYSFQDYVAKTKYLELKGRKPVFRFLMQNFVKTLVAKTGEQPKIIDRLGIAEVKKI